MLSEKFNLGELGRQIFAKLIRVTSSDGNYEDILYECKQNNQKFTDESFPPS